MTSGIYEGIAIFQDPNSTSQIKVAGNGSETITGMIYAPRATLNVTGNGSTIVLGSQVIVYDLNVKGNGTMAVNYVGGTAGRTRVVGLVE
jgi:hypothetical protein